MTERREAAINTGLVCRLRGDGHEALADALSLYYKTPDTPALNMNLIMMSLMELGERDEAVQIMADSFFRGLDRENDAIELSDEEAEKLKWAGYIIDVKFRNYIEHIEAVEECAKWMLGYPAANIDLRKVIIALTLIGADKEADKIHQYLHLYSYPEEPLRPELQKSDAGLKGLAGVIDSVKGSLTRILKRS